MKLNAFNHRDKIRDLYDIIFIYQNYKKILPAILIEQLRDAFAHKGIEQFDFLIKYQQDELINTDELANNFLNTFNELGLL